jgi:hypothetical protein
MTRPLLFLGLFALAGCGESPQDVPATQLGQAVDSLAIPYSYVSDATWLGNGRWAFVAPNERIVVIADFEGDSIGVLGGSRPIQYQDPYLVFRAGDSLYVGDWGKRSLTVWGLNGAFGRVIPATSFAGGALPEARDNQGRFYSLVHPPARNDGSGQRDSAFILRTSPDLAKVDTIGRLAPPDIAEVLGESGRRYTPRAMSGRDKWGVLPDGTLWIARINQNRIDWRTPEGKWEEGGPLPDRVLTVTPEDRERFLLQFPEELRSSAEQTPFAIIKPAFESGFSDPAGRVWLVKSYSLYDTTRMGQVVAEQGDLLQQVEYPGYGRLAGTNGELALVSDVSEKGHRLLLFRVPPPTPSP